MNTKFAALLLASVALTGSHALATPVATIECATTQTECLNQWFDERFEEELAFSPLLQAPPGKAESQANALNINCLDVQRKILEFRTFVRYA